VILSLSYLVEFESASYSESYKPEKWADLAPRGYLPDKILQMWGLETPELREMLKASRKRTRNQIQT
jgi:hypothetical protein